MKKKYICLGSVLLLVTGLNAIKYNNEYKKNIINDSRVVAVAEDDTLKNQLQDMIDKVSGVKDNYKYIKTMKSTKNGIVVGYEYNISKYGITEEAASYVLEKMIEDERSKMEKYTWFNNLDDVRQDAVINLAFNLGTFGLLKFKKTISHLEAGRYDSAYNSLLFTSRGTKTLYYRQVKGRAKEIAEQLKTGVAKEPLIPTLKRHEGFRVFPYKDTKGIWTVGYGINLENRGFNEEEALLLLAFGTLQNEELLNHYA